jgi:glutamate--cysteine ligase
MRERSAAARDTLLALPFSAEQQAVYRRQAEESHARRQALEAADTVDFETFRVAYLAPERLLPA